MQQQTVRNSNLPTYQTYQRLWINLPTHFCRPARANDVSRPTLILVADCPPPLGGPSAVRLFDTTRQAAAGAAVVAVHRRRRRTTEGEKGRGAQITHHESILAIGSGGG